MSDEIRLSLARIEKVQTEHSAALRTLADGHWDLTRRVSKLEGIEESRPPLASRADVGAGDTQLKAEMGVMKADTDARIAALAGALASGSESRTTQIMVVLAVVCIVIVVAVKMPSDQFVTALTVIAGIGTGAWMQLRQSKKRTAEVNGSIPPPKG